MYLRIILYIYLDMQLPIQFGRACCLQQGSHQFSMTQMELNSKQQTHILQRQATRNQCGEHLVYVFASLLEEDYNLQRNQCLKHATPILLRPFSTWSESPRYTRGQVYKSVFLSNLERTRQQKTRYMLW